MVVVLFFVGLTITAGSAVALAAGSNTCSYPPVNLAGPTPTPLIGATTTSGAPEITLLSSVPEAAQHYYYGRLVEDIGGSVGTLPITSSSPFLYNPYTYAGPYSYPEYSSETVIGYDHWFNQSIAIGGVNGELVNGSPAYYIDPSAAATQEGGQEALRLVQQFIPSATLVSYPFPGEIAGQPLDQSVALPNGLQLNAGLVLTEYYNEGKYVDSNSEGSLIESLQCSNAPYAATNTSQQPISAAPTTTLPGATTSTTYYVPTIGSSGTITTGDTGGWVQLSPGAAALGYTVSVHDLGASDQQILLNISSSRTVEIKIDPNLIQGQYIVDIMEPQQNSVDNGLPMIQVWLGVTMELQVSIPANATSITLNSSALNIPGAYGAWGSYHQPTVTSTLPAATSTPPAATALVNALTQLVSLLHGLLAPSGNAASGTANLAGIQQLLSQFEASLLGIVSSTQPTATPPAWCYTFTTNLSIGMTGPGVTALQTALQKDGETVTINGTFDDQAASAVTAFQEKYAKDILAPHNLTNGTGYVGSATITKLNSLYGCSGE